MRLLFAGFPHSRSYQGSRPGTAEAWAAGEERDVPSDTGEYLLSEFSGAFLPVPGSVVAEVLAAPTFDRAMKSPASQPGKRGHR